MQSMRKEPDGIDAFAVPEPSRRKAAVWATLVVASALAGTLLLYREALHLPFLFDDMVHLRWLDWHSLPAIWTTAEGLGYYRPLTMSFWKIGHLLQGRYDPGVFHTLNLALHALNAGLAGYIAWRAHTGRGRQALALLTTLLFVSFPFSYQAVPSTSSLSKPLIATLMLGSTLLYWEARRYSSRLLLGASLLVGFLAPFAYETGVMLPVAILAVELLGQGRKEFAHRSWLPVVYMILLWGVTLPLVILMEPETGASVGLSSPLSLWQNGVYFVEGLLFPITPLGTSLEQALAVDRYVLLTIISALAFAALFAFYLWVEKLKLLFYALSWFVVGVAPLWLMLDFAYVITSPRLLYLGAVGISMLWAGVPVFLWTRLPSRWWPKVLSAAAIVVILSFNMAYVRDKMELAQTLSAPLWQAAHAAEAHGNSSRLLYLNVPAWIAPKEPTYRIGTEGLTFIPEYVRVQDFVYVTTGVEPEVRAFMFDPTKQDWQAYVGYAGAGLDWDALTAEIREADSVHLTTYLPDQLHFVEAGSMEAANHTPSSSAPLARFGDSMLLIESQVEPAGSQLVVNLWWYSQEIPDKDITVFLHVYDGTGKLIAQADGYPLLGLFPPQRWQLGDRVRDVRYLELPDATADQPYTVAVGWYDTATGQRLPAFDREGNPVAQDAFRIFPPEFRD
jgi:hypothetical protein